LSTEPHVVLSMNRVKGLVVPADQARDFKELSQFIERNTSPQEPIFVFPELGAYHFILDRPFVGRFPMATFSWMKEAWHQELMRDLKGLKPKFALVDRAPGQWFEEVYFKVPTNREKYDEVLAYIESNYRLVVTTPGILIYQLR
jgi:uncharacterized protein YozE (UPF0346 family)